MFEFHVIGGETVREIISRRRADIVDKVRKTYLLHADHQTVNPDSYFLRFPDKPDSRIIALPAFLGGPQHIAGIKWISSFPENIAQNVPRASAVLLLNDYQTGYPFALLEGAQISAARTAAGAVLATQLLVSDPRSRTLGVVGAGVISRTVLEFYEGQGWLFDRVLVHDLRPQFAQDLAGFATSRLGWPAAESCPLDRVLGESEVILLATSAAQPYISEPGSISPGQLVLNISLRDIAPELIADSHNILDDVDHCLKANTSPHLAEQKYGHRDFVTGTLADLITGDLAVGRDKPVIFSPFGLGILDLAVGHLIYQDALATGTDITMPEFFGNQTRW